MTENLYAVLPGVSDEQILLLTTHGDGFFQGAMDNASGMATGIDIARHYARRLPRPSARAPWCSWRFPTITTVSSAARPGYQDLRLDQGWR